MKLPLKRFCYLLAWAAALWQLWQAITVGCFRLGHIETVHCFAQHPFLYLFDFAVVLIFVFGLPFLLYDRR